MITSQRRPALSPPITRDFEPTRIHRQSLANAYQVLMPDISRQPGWPRPRIDDDTTGATIPGLRSRAEGA